jgi:GT2 family glycosyltransferase
VSSRAGRDRRVSHDGAAAMSGAPVVSIVIVTYGTGPIVLEALDAVALHTSLEYEVILVDCPPVDQARRTSHLLSGRSDIELLAVDENLGFAGGNELGVEHASGEYLCFLNPDVIVAPGWIEPLVAALDDPEVGIAAPVFLNDDGSLQEAGQLIFADTFTAPVGGPGVMAGDRTNIFSRDVEYASAACWVVRRSDHVALGGFDRRYHPAYFEDADYALRMQASGRRTRLVADVPVVHHSGQGTGVRHAALGQATHARFKRQWGAHLSDHAGRPSTTAEVVAARDRLVGTSTLFVAWSDEVSAASRLDLFERALETALARPRDRVTFLSDVAPPAFDDQRARVAGLEVVVEAGSVAERSEIAAVRSTIADEVINAGTAHADRPRRRVRTWIAVAVVFVAGVVIRWLLFDTPAAVINADEAYTRLETFEILRGQFPMVLGGTVYTLPVEAYLYTPFTYLFNGANVVPLKLLSTLSWFGTAVTLFFIGRRLVSERVGVIAAALCWITPGALMVLSITAYPAYASGMLVTTLAFLVATRILEAPAPGPSRPLLVLFGVLAGFAFWLHPMFLTVMVPMTAVVLWSVRRRVDAVLSVIGGGIVGCLPLLVWNAVNGWPSLESPVEVPGSYTDRLRTFFVDLFPRAFGLRNAGLNWYHAFWGPVLYAALLAVSALGLWTIGRRSRARGRIVLFVVLGLVFFLMAFLQNLIYANDGRYAMISLPFVFIVLAAGIDQLAGRRPPWRVVGVLTLVTAIWLVGFVRPNAQPFLDQRGVDPNAQLDEIVDLLDERGIDRVYGSYWAVLPVDFAGDNRIVSGVFPFWPIRFPDRQRVVGATPPENVAVVYMSYDEDPAYLLMPSDRYERIVVGDRVVYLPLPNSAVATAEG